MGGQLQRLVLDFRGEAGEVVARILYKSDGRSNPGTKARRRDGSTLGVGGRMIFAHDLTGFRQASEGSLVDTVAHAEAVAKELNNFIERRSRKGGVDPDEREELWKESVRLYNARRREENRQAWCGYFERLAMSLRARAEEYDCRAALLEDRGGGA